MIAIEEATTSNETPVLIDSPMGTLFAVTTEPVANGTGLWVVMLPGAHFPGVNRNRLFVQLARRLSRVGLHSIRFDYHGVGESTGVLEGYELGKPFVQDLEATVDWARRRGARGFILVGLCFGARTALEAARSMPDLRGLVLITTPLVDFEKGTKGAAHIALEETSLQLFRRALRPKVLLGLFKAKQRRVYAAAIRTRLRMFRGRGGHALVNARAIDALMEITATQTPVLMVYGTEDENFKDFKRFTEPRRSDLSASLEVETVPGQIAGFSQLELQEGFLDRVHHWLDSQSLTTESG